MTPRDLTNRLLEKGNAKILLSQEARDAIKKNVGSVDLANRYGGASVFSMQRATEAEAAQEAADAKSSVFAMQEQGQYPAGGKDAESARIARSWAVVDPTIAPILEKGRVNAVVANAFFNGVHEAPSSGVDQTAQSGGKRANPSRIEETEQDLEQRASRFLEPYDRRIRGASQPEKVLTSLTTIPDPSDPENFLKGKYKWSFGRKGKASWRDNPVLDPFATQD